MKIIIFGHFVDGFPIMETAHDRQRFFELLAYYERLGGNTIDAINTDGNPVPSYVKDWLSSHKEVRLER